MPYSSIADILSAIGEKRLAVLTDDESAGEVNEGRVTDAIARADAEIDAYVCRVTALPLTTVPAVVKRLSIDIACYHLYSRKDRDEMKEQRYAECVQLLKGIAAGGGAATSSKSLFESPAAASIRLYAP
jgi:phage gp36-like protein